MKKTFSIFAIIAIAVITMFTSCSDDDDKLVIKGSDVYGTWNVTDVQGSDGKWVDVTLPQYKDLRAYAHFYPSGSYYGGGALCYGSGTWTLTDNIIKTYYEGSLYITYTVKSLKGDYMTGTMSDSKTSLNFKAKREED